MRPISSLLRVCALFSFLVFSLSARAQLAATTATTQVTASTTSSISTMPVTASGGTGPYAFAIAPALPTGLSFDAATGTITGTVASAYLAPAFVGSDDFSTAGNTGWAYEQHLPNTADGALTVTNGRLEFSTSGGTSSHVKGWKGSAALANLPIAASFNQSWVMEMTATHNGTTGTGEFSTFGFQVTDSDPTTTHYLAVMIGSSGGSRIVRSENVDGTTSILNLVGPAAPVRLRLAWDAGAKVLKTSCSTDGGATYSALQTIAPAAKWGANPTGGFWFEVFGNTNVAGSILPGTIYGDDFRISAGAPTTETVTVTDAASGTAQGAFTLSVAPVPVITSITPANAGVGTRVTIAGTDLAGATSVTFGGVTAVFTYDPTTRSISATIPPAARTGAVQVTTAGGASNSVTYSVGLTITTQPGHNVVTAGQATSVSVVAGGGAPGAYTYQWRKNGTAVTGATNQVYYVLAMSAGDEGDYDVVVSDGTNTVTGGPAALRVATPALWTWRNPLPTGNDFNAVAYGAGRYVAIGQSGTIVTSTDRTTWVPQPQQPPVSLTNIAFGGGQFVAVGSNGNLLTSTDGLSWTQRNLGTAGTLWGVTYANAKWVVTGANGALFTSADGATWAAQTSGTGATINAVKGSASGFMAITSDGRVLTSDANAATWSSAQPFPNRNLIDLGVSSAGYVIGATDTVFFSANGTSWNPVTLPTTDTGIDWGRVLVTSGGFTVVGASYPFTSATPKGYIIQSADGANWTLKTIPGGPGLQGIATDGTGYVAVGVVGQILASADGATWTRAAAGFTMPGDFYASATGAVGTLFAGSSGKVVRATNHETNWTQVSVGASDSFYGGTNAAGKYVFVGSSDDNANPMGSVISSTDTNTWTRVTIADTPVLNAVAYDSFVKKWVAAGFGGNLYWATDPAGTWTAVAKPATATATIRAGTVGVGRYVLVGDSGTVLFSKDAVNWTAATPVTGVSLQAVAYGNGRFVAAGFNSSSASLRSIIITSTDGLNWQPVSVPFTGSIRGMMYADGRFVTVGGSASVLVSNDGLNWEAGSSQFSGLFRAIVRTPVGYAAAGTSGAIATITAPTVTTSVTQQTLSVGVAANLTPVTASGGHGPYTFTLSPMLGTGLMLDPSSGAISGTPAAAAAMAPFAGGDDFNSGSDAKWAYYFRTLGAASPGNGLLAFTNSRLDFSKGAGAGSYFLGTDADGDPATPYAHTTASFATSWVADVTATNTYSAAASEYADVGVQVAGANAQYAAILLLNRAETFYVRAGSAGVATPVEATITNGNAVKLRLAWNATTQQLVASYSTDAGANYTTLTTFTPVTSWLPGAAAGGFGFEVFGESSAATAIPSGALSLDDFSVKATAPVTTVYTVTVSDSVGLTASSQSTLTVLPGPTIATVSPASAAAGATVTITGANLANVTAVKFNGVSATSFNVVSATQITAVVPSGATSGPVTVENSPTATGASPSGFTVLLPPTILDQPVSRRVVAGGTIGFTVSAAGSTPFTYQWMKDGQDLPGATTSFIKVPKVSSTSAGTYSVRVTNVVSSVTSQDATVTVLPADAVLWQQFTEYSTEQSPARTVNSGGKVYVPFSVQSRTPDMVAGHWVGALARLNEADGTLDATFRLDAHFRAATHVAVQTDGKLVIGVRAGDASTVIRTDSTGAIDPTFTAPLFARSSRFVTLQTDGKVLVAATDNADPDAPATALGAAAPTIYRLNADGTVDSTFTPAVLDGNAALFGEPVVDGNGKIYLAGTIHQVNGTARTNIARLNADGTLDTAYAGTLPAGFGSNQARATLLQSDGRAVFIGDFRSTARGTFADPMMAVRFNADGTYDTTFAQPLRSEVGLGTTGIRLRAAVLNPDDTIVAVSDRLVRLTANGAVDSTFAARPLQKEAFWVSRGTSGKLFVADESAVRGISAFVSTVSSGIAAFAADGAPDFSFQTGGWGRVAYPTDGAVLSDGRVWVAGDFNRYGGTAVPGLAQFAANGSLSTAQVASTRSMTAATIAPTTNDGVYAVLTSARNSTETAAPMLARVRADGSLDTSFSPALPSGYDLNAATLHPAPNGGVLLSQEAITEQAALNGSTGDALLRLKADGTRDTAYAPTLSSFAQVDRDANNQIAMMRTGGLYVAQVLADGSAYVVAAGINGSLSLVRLTSTGAVDTTFTPPSFGTVTPSVGYTSVLTDPVTNTTSQFQITTYSASGVIGAVATTTDGKIYVAGRLSLNGAPRGLVRLNADGTLDTSFTGAGAATTAADGGPYVAGLVVDATNRVYLAGKFDHFNGTPAHGIARLLADGTVDSAWTPGFDLVDAPVANASLQVVGQKLYAFGTVARAGDTLPVPYAVVDIPYPLVVTQAPVATTALVGTASSLSVTVTTASPATYQWYKGTQAISGATTATLTFATPALTDEGTYSVAITNAAGTVTTTPVLLTVNAAPAITVPPTNATAVLGTSASFSVTATGKPAVAYQWYKGTTAIPGATNATLAFAAVQNNDAGSYAVRVSNSVSAVTSSAVTLTVNPTAPTITSPLTATAIAGRSFVYGITTNPTPVTFGATGLPSGLTVDTSSGVITGVPSTAGSYSVTLTATNVTAGDTRTLTLTVNPPPPIINSAASVSARVGGTFTYTIAAVNTPTAYAATGLPAGLTIDTATGAITGTPTAAGVFTVMLAATNAGGTTTSPLVLTIDPPLNAPSFTGSPQVSGVQNSAFSFTPAFNTSGLTATYSADTLPNGLSIDSATGAITGTPTATGTFTVNITATSSGGTTTVPFTFTVNPPPTAPVISSNSMATATVGSAFSFTLTANSTPTSFGATGLPASGLSLNSTTGVISGTPTAPGTLTLQVSAANNVGTGPNAALVITINPSPNAPIINSGSIAAGRAGDPLTYTLTATNSPTAFAVTSGTLPSGLTLNPGTGAITGSPVQAGQFPVWFAASNANGAGYALQVVFSIAPAITTPAVTSNGTAAGQVGQPFSYQITATNAPTSFAATGLPASLTLNASTGVISGIPAEATTSALSVSLTATNASGTSTPKTLLLSIAPAPATPVITSPLNAAAQSGSAFTYTITASDSPTSFVATNLPAGLALNSTTGVITGTPITSGPASVSIRAANAAGLGAASTLVLNIAPAPSAPAITSAASASGKVGVSFTYTITTTGTATGYGVTGSLPLGLTLNTSTGVISGSPAASGVFTVQLTATGAGGASLPQALVLNIAPADNAPVITSPIYASATVGQDFSYQITAASSPAFPSAPFAAPFTLDATNLPTGLAVNPSTGIIEGKPTAAGVFTAALVGTNSAGTGPTRDLTIFVSPAPTAPTVTSTPYAAAQVGMAFAYQITATNSPSSFDILGLPAWMTINSASGAVAGVPTSPGTFTVQLVASNTAGASAPVTLTITVAPSVNAPVVTSSRTATGTVSQSFSYTITSAVRDGAPPVTSYVATGVPAGLSLNAVTGVISGTPTSSGQYEVTLIARNSAGDSQPVTLILTINPSLQFNFGQ